LPQDLFPWELATYVVGAMLLMLGLSALIVWVMLKFIPQV
jgi:farnesyl-diphosphate farnesyltransferase